MRGTHVAKKKTCIYKKYNKMLLLKSFKTKMKDLLRDFITLQSGTNTNKQSSVLHSLCQPEVRQAKG